MVIENRLIVCIASAWDYDPTSKHHVMRILSRRNRILWVNYHGTRRPGINATDISTAWSKLRRVAQGVQPASSTISQVTPLVIPGARSRLASGLHRRLLISQIRRAVRKLDPEGRLPVQVWSFAPDVPFLMGRFNEECFVYYCVDEFALFEGIDSYRVKVAENELIDGADVVITTSEKLHESRRSRRSDAVLIPHGVDFDHFATAWRSPPPRPHDLACIPKPMFGFFGLIQHWVDLELLLKVARLRPRYSFVLIGDSMVDDSALRRAHNVYLLGRRSYVKLPAY